MGGAHRSGDAAARPGGSGAGSRRRAGMPGERGSGCGPVAGSVLVVEDEREIRELLRRYLERAGLPVLTAAGGAEAIRMLGEGAARLVLLDLGLPDVDGEEVLRAARAAGEVPVIVLTARSAAEDRIRGLTLGADDYVTKPFSPTEVVLRVQAVLHRQAEWGGAGRGLLRRRPPARRRGQARGGTRRQAAGPDPDGVGAAHRACHGAGPGLFPLRAGQPGPRYEFEGYERIIDSHVKNLRHKLGAAARRSWRPSLASGTGWDCAVTRSSAAVQPPGAAAARGVRRCRAVVGRDLDRGRPDRRRSGAVRGPSGRTGSRPPAVPPRRPPTAYAAAGELGARRSRPGTCHCRGRGRRPWP